VKYLFFISLNAVGRTEGEATYHITHPDFFIQLHWQYDPI